ncbi:hypothetical protein CRG98_008744 [Punica granatum]|uniref:Uncharacterized protein n=1 Tax=Punica granatum TaxID=22663 RepID=A0A2I0KRD0_PUNGR|nr:hypothetical protein CRG98_008744 [Punica granatum]
MEEGPALHPGRRVTLHHLPQRRCREHSPIIVLTVRTRISSHRGTHARAYTMRLVSVHLPRDARQTHLRSRHLPFYDPEIEARLRVSSRRNGHWWTALENSNSQPSWG